MKHIAPVLIVTLCRYNHFKRCVESLLMNPLAIDTDLYISLDYPSQESHWEGYLKIKSYIKDINGFNSVNIIYRERNLGAVANYIDSMNLVLGKYDRVIFSEDDNEFSSSFLEFMNKGLLKCETNLDLFAVCGYMHPIKGIENFSSTYFELKHFSAWGYGILRDRENINQSYRCSEKILELVEDKNIISFLKKNRLGEVIHLLDMYKTGNILGDSLISTIILKENKRVLFPKQSLVKNNGWDGSGIHGGKVPLYANQIIDTSTHFNNFNTYINESDKVNSIIYSFFKTYTPLYRNILNKLIWLIYQISGRIYTFESMIKYLRRIRTFYYQKK